MRCLHDLMQKLYLRRCPDPEFCGDPDTNWHTHHLTWLGRLRYTGRI